MSMDESELIGGISVSLGASHERLVSDLAEANRLAEKWAQQTFTARVGVQFTGAQGGAAARPAAPPPSIAVGPATRTQTQAAQAQTALQRAINAELAKTGETYNAVTGEIEGATSAVTKQRQAVVAVQQAAAQPARLELDTGTLQADLKAILAQLHDIVAEAKALSEMRVAPQAEAQPPRPVAPQRRAQVNVPPRVTPAPEVRPVEPQPQVRPQPRPQTAPQPARVQQPQPAPVPVQPRPVVAPRPAPLPRPAYSADPEKLVQQDARAEERAARIRESAVAAEDRRAARLETSRRSTAVRVARDRVAYSADPEALAEKDALAEARAARLRERAVADEDRRAARVEAQQVQQAQREDQRRRRSLPPQTPPGRDFTLVGSPYYHIGEFEFHPPGARPGLSTGQLEESRLTAPQMTPERRAQDEQEQQARAAADARIAASRTDAQRRAQAERDRQTAERANRPGIGGPAQAQAEREAVAAGRRADTQTRSFEQRQQQALFRRQVQEAQIVRQQEQAQAVAQAQVTAAGRTARTTASGLAGFFGGPRREQIEAQTALAAARSETASATRYLATFENEMIRNEVNARHATVDEAAALRDRNKEIARSPEYTDAVQQRTKAIAAEGAATQRVQKLSEGASTAARTLLAVTAGGAAFGLGLKAVDTVLGSIIPALENFVDIQTGFGATSTRVTSALGTQTLALKGNADAALAAQEAQAGFSAAGADALNVQLKLATQIKAGAQAQQQAVDLQRAATGVGNAPTGLFGGFGGVGGTAFLAQQLGGGKGFTEGVLQQAQAAAGRGGGPNLLGNFNAGVGVLTSPDTLRSLAGVANQSQGRVSVPGAAGLRTQIENTPVVGQLNDLLNLFGQGVAPTAAQKAQPQAGPPETQTSLAFRNDLNKAAERGKTALGESTQASYEYTTSVQEIADATKAAAQAGDVYGVTLAQQYGLVVRLGNAVAKSGDDYTHAIEQFAVGRGIQAPELIGRNALLAEQQRQRESAASLPALLAQQAFARPAFFGQLTRTQQLQANVQLPAQAYLQNLANPPVPVGTGIPRADRRSVAGDLRAAQDAQKQLNDYYAQGQQIVEDTYKPAIIQTFGAAAGQVFSGLLTQIEKTGQAIAATQAGISNEQAAYQVAQYNFQLFIARRTLADIGGLTGRNFGAGESYLGVLEGQNLALSRQAQLLQFGMSQRQINFQTALAGFQVPGLTPAEQNARVEEAKKEAGYAQKQLDIQRQMFGNQVKIVDISNLRQGADLVKQIALLQRGRQVTIDIAADQQKLERLTKIQQRLVAEANTYFNAVDQEIAKASSDMTAIEAQTGHAIARTEKQGVAAAYAVGRAFYIGITGGLMGYNTSGGGGGANDAQTPRRHASGGVFNTQGMTNLGPYGVAGEAGGETVAILAHPHALQGAGSGGNVTVNFNGDINVRSETDIDTLVRKITQVQGRTAALKGLRSPN